MRVKIQFIITYYTTPKISNDLTFCKIMVLILYSKLMFPFLLVIVIILQMIIFRHKPFCTHHLYNTFKSFCIVMQFLSSIIVLKIFKSSAYIRHSDNMSEIKSLVNIRKKRGSKLDPCGTPLYMISPQLFQHNLSFHLSII